MYQENIRVEELDSDDTDTRGAAVNGGGRRFFSDPLQFTGIDMAPKSRKAYAYQSDSDSSDSGESDDGNVSAAQIALRDKEEALVQSALARIRRAQEKGKLEVKLREDELAALENRRKRMQAAEKTSKSKTKKDKASGSVSRKKKSSPPMVTIPIVQPDGQRPVSRRRSKQQHLNDTALSAPGMLVEGADGRVTYAPIDFRPSSSHHASPSRPRSSSSQAHSQRGPPQQYPYAYPPPTNRHVSDGGRPTSSASMMGPRPPLPHEEGWVPGDSRRGSVSSQFSHDPFEYQVLAEQPPPMPMEYAGAGGGRRYVGGPPPEVQYGSIRRSPPGGAYAGEGRRYSGPRDRREDEESSSEEEDDESDELGNGVRVVPERVREVVPVRKPVAGRKKKR